jgi:Glycosyltransferase family 87
MNRATGPLLIVLVGTAIVLYACMHASLGIDYAGSSLGVNRTGDAVQALASADFERFFATQPAIGPGSVILRAPFAALAGISHDLVALAPRYDGTPPLVLPPEFAESQERLYKFGLFPCLMALVLIGAAASPALTRRGVPLGMQLLTALLILGLPLWHNAVTLGHPDEFLTTGVTLGAVIAALSGRATTAAVLLGLALASKQWAILALPAVALAVPPAQARRTVAVTIAVYVALMVPMAIGNPDRFADTLTAPSTSSHGLVDADTIWLPFASVHDKTVFDGVEHLVFPHRELPDALESLIHPAIVVIAFGLSLLFWRRRQPPDPESIFLLLALIFLLRCMLDPVTNHYYHAPFLASLALYEAFARHRIPVLTLVASAVFLPRLGIDATALERTNLIYLVWSLPMAAWLGLTLFRRQPLRPKL